VRADVGLLLAVSRSRYVHELFVEPTRYDCVGEERSSIDIALDSATGVPKRTSSFGFSKRCMLPRSPTCQVSPMRPCTPRAVCA
jgi:hypothetical protein